MSEAARWDRMSEAGSRASLGIAGWIVRHLGRRATLAIARVTSAFFVLRRGAARRASGRYLARVAASPGGPDALGVAQPGVRAVHRHFTEFSRVLYDRMLAWSGGLDSLDFDHDGSDRIFGLARSGQGALLLGAHVGSLDLMGFITRRYALKMNVVVFHRNAERINAFLEALGAPSARMIQLEPGSVRAAFEVRSCLERGEFVAMMADRAMPGAAARSATTRFLGGDARFPLGPFLLAGVLGCPVYLALCLRSGDARYTTVMRELTAGERVPRRQREAWARELLARYAARVEEVCRRHPFQWFNFFDFWEDEAR